MDEWIDEISASEEAQNLATNLARLASRIDSFPTVLDEKMKKFNFSVVPNLRKHCLLLASDLRELANDIRGEY